MTPRSSYTGLGVLLESLHPLLMAPQFPGVPTKYVVRPLLSAPSPITLPIILTNIIPEQFPTPRMLTDIDPRRTPTPPPAPRRAPTPPRRAPSPPRRAPSPPRRQPTPARRAPAPAPPRRQISPDSRESSLTPAESDDDDDDSSLAGTKPHSQIKRPSGANIQTVKSLFKERYPDLTQQDQEKEYTQFRVRFFHISLTTP